MSDRISVSIADGVADVRLNRPDKMNALDMAMFNALRDTGEELAGNGSVRAVVLSGEGRAFCAGLDFGNFKKMGDGEGSSVGRLTPRTHGIANHAQQAVWIWRQMPQPVIAAVTGVAFGGGCQIALGADIRLIAPDARMSVLEIKWGLVPDMAGLALMRTLLRDDIARELTYTGRQVTGQEAVDIGLATRVEENPYAAAMAMAREIASKSPDAVRGSKRLLNMVADADEAAILLAESVEQEKLIGSPNQIEAVKAGLGKRAPNFTDVA
ncbi:MAG: crotonase/enoyl-CoA hydratase family protein [Minwuia sp.]|uniref:crotonase/enoyl-CoA hydratase family protein n=1 Tax=Minwuia sp. TaxID=2493630 RepID=UPI003A8585EB